LSTVIFCGQTTTGFAVSCTVTLNSQNEPVVRLVQRTVVVPTGKELPEAGEHVTVPQAPVVVGSA